jgi:lipoprotein-releasing system ATP-binding protein
MNKSSAETPAILQANNLVKEFQTGGKTIRVLDQINFTIHANDYISIQGPSGVGKTTLLHILGLIDTPTDGELLVDGTDVVPLADRKRSEIRNQKFGFVFQFYHLIAELTALENVLMPTMISESPLSWFGSRNDHQERGRKLLDQVGLSSREHHHPNQLSGGERQRVAIARALIMEPDVLFCDEPTGNLDQETGKQVYDLLEQLRADHQTALVLATHDDNLSNRASKRMSIETGHLEPQKSGVHSGN